MDHVVRGGPGVLLGNEVKESACMHGDDGVFDSADHAKKVILRGRYNCGPVKFMQLPDITYILSTSLAMHFRFFV
jgi:hypothetical protein